MAREFFLIPAEKIVRGILWLRGQRVMLDADLAQLYGVTTKRHNEQVKRNRKRFPKDFLFVLTAKEKAEVVANCDHLQRLKFPATLPRAFTEHEQFSIVFEAIRRLMQPPEKKLKGRIGFRSKGEMMESSEQNS